VAGRGALLWKTGCKEVWSRRTVRTPPFGAVLDPKRAPAAHALVDHPALVSQSDT
jgi:hypothetical protein